MKSLAATLVRRTYSARALRLHAQAQAHLAAAQPDRAESLLRAALVAAEPSDTALRARLSALLVDATNSSSAKGVASAALLAASRTEALDVCEAARLRANAANSAADAHVAYEQIVAAFGKESPEAALALSNVGVWHAHEKNSHKAVEALQEAAMVIARVLGANNGSFAAIAANLRVLGRPDVVAEAQRVADEASQRAAALVLANNVDVASIEALDERAKFWSLCALPGRLDPDGVVMDKQFTRRVLHQFFALQPQLAADGRLFDWLSREVSLHGVTNDDGFDAQAVAQFGEQKQQQHQRQQ